MMILIYSENKKKRDINVRVTRARVRRNVFRRLVEESIVCVYAQKDQARETKKRDSYFLDRILFRVYTDTLNSKQARPRERDATENFDAFD